MAKEVSTPKQSGGGGYTFADKVGASYLLKMLAGSPPLDADTGQIESMRFEKRVDGWFLDDIVLFLRRIDHESAAFAISISAPGEDARPAKLGIDEIIRGIETNEKAWRAQGSWMVRYTHFRERIDAVPGAMGLVPGQPAHQCPQGSVDVRQGGAGGRTGADAYHHGAQHLGPVEGRDLHRAGQAERPDHERRAGHG